MKLYNWTDEGEYCGATEAALDPRETELQGQPAYLMPARSTTEEPPAPGKKQTVVRIGNSWEIRPDHRGEIWFDTKPRGVRIGAIGDPHEWGLHAGADIPKGEKKAPKWNDKHKAWELIPDHRGETWFDANRLPVPITETGDPREKGLMTAEELEALPKPVPLLSPVQLRLHLLSKGIDDAAVDAAIASSGLQDLEKKRVAVYWRHALHYDAADPFMQAIGSVLGMADLETEFRAATSQP